MGTLSKIAKEQKFINFGLPIDLYVEFEQAIDYLNSSKAELLRESIRSIVKKTKRERIQQNLREAYNANNEILEKEAEVWDYVSVEGL
ncbi:MAG: hypothetical protein IIA58_01525 [Candidatus Marinimicrobia bacterium]|nr:hypothetical protein [Candidatus Neomarinimicrobiota bacterium]